MAHLQAMPTVRAWEYTSRFGHVGFSQTDRANRARILEYFSDCYEDLNEAAGKAELFLSVSDYLARHAALFSKKGLVETAQAQAFSVDPALLRALHHVFSVAAWPTEVAPKKVIALARAFQAIKPAA